MGKELMSLAMFSPMLLPPVFSWYVLISFPLGSSLTFCRGRDVVKSESVRYRIVLIAQSVKLPMSLAMGGFPLSFSTGSMC